MGLDLIVEGCSKPGQELEWRQLLQRSFAEEELSDQEVARFQKLSIPADANMGGSAGRFRRSRKPMDPQDAKRENS